MGFKARVVLSLSHCDLYTVSLRVISGATPAFSTNRGVHCLSIQQAHLPDIPYASRGGQAVVGCEHKENTLSLRHASVPGN